MRYAAALLALLGALAALAVLSFLNVVQTAVNASLAPVAKELNGSVYPLAKAWYSYAGFYNVTYYYMRFVPGWPELYTVGLFAPRQTGWQSWLEAVGRSGTGQYAIALGGQVQITQSQNSGPPVAISQNTPLQWQTLATQRYSVLARAWFKQGGITAVQLVNFTAEPMSKLYSQTFSCGTTTYVEQFYYCTTQTFSYSDSFSYTTLPPYITKYLNYDPTTVTVPPVSIDTTNSPTTPPSLKTQVDTRSTGAAIIAAVYNTAARWGLIQSYGTTVAVSLKYQRDTDDTRNNVAYISIAVDTNGDGRPDVELIYYYYDITDEDENGAIYSVFVNPGAYLASVSSTGGLRYAAGVSNGTTYYFYRMGSMTSGSTYSFSRTLAVSGYIVAVAFVVVDPSDYASGSPDGDFWVWWDDFKISGTGTVCSLPGNVAVYTRGYNYTQVYIAPGVGNPAPSLATEVDAYGASGNPQTDWGAAVAVYKLAQPVPALGTTVSVWGLYQKDANDVSNNVAYVSIGVDVNGDGQVDKEYILYRSDTGGGPGAIVSAFFKDSAGNPVYVCTVDTTGACAATDPRFVVINLGAMTSGSSYTWSYTLNDQGAVVAIALAATDGSRYGEGYSGDVWVYWDNLQLQYSACPLPAGWSVSGAYAWQSYNYLLASGSVAVYMGLVAGGLTYVSNFTGVGAYVVFDSSLTPIFGVSISGSGFSALCGSSAVSLGSLPSARWVELRPLSGLGDIIVRDQYGNILARYGCPYAAVPQYIGYKTTNTLKIYNITALG